MSLLFDVLVAVLALAGLAALALAWMLSRPLVPPPPLGSILDGALEIDPAGLPDLERFQARDGTWLGFRRYRPANGAAGRYALLAHGSAGASPQMNAVANGLMRAGIASVAVDLRGHGVSGTRGDVVYSGQLDDDLADLIDHLRAAEPDVRLIAFVGHSAGGGFGLRVAAGPLGKTFERYVLLAPYLGHRAPTIRIMDAAKSWASADVPRIIAIGILARLGINWPQALPVLGFATGPGAKKFVTDEYTFRLMTSYAAPDDWKAGFQKAAAPAHVICGADDELMDADAFARVLKPLGVDVTILPGVDHMALCWRPEAIAAIVAAVEA